MQNLILNHMIVFHLSFFMDTHMNMNLYFNTKVGTKYISVKSNFIKITEEMKANKLDQ